MTQPTVVSLNSTLPGGRCAERSGGDTADIQSHPSVGLAAESLAFTKYQALLHPDCFGQK